MRAYAQQLQYDKQRAEEMLEHVNADLEKAKGTRPHIEREGLIRAAESLYVAEQQAYDIGNYNLADDFLQEAGNRIREAYSPIQPAGLNSEGLLHQTGAYPRLGFREPPGAI
jgi:hypothetical protein